MIGCEFTMRDRTVQVIAAINSTREGVIFLLWGNNAKKKGSKIDRKKHVVLESVHPSGLSPPRAVHCDSTESVSGLRAEVTNTIRNASPHCPQHLQKPIDVYIGQEGLPNPKQLLSCQESKIHQF